MREAKIKLAKLIIGLRILQVLAIAIIPIIMFIIWKFCFTNDVLYFCVWWAILGLPITTLVAIVTNEKIKLYKHVELKKIYRRR